MSLLSIKVTQLYILSFSRTTFHQRVHHLRHFVVGVAAAEGEAEELEAALRVILEGAELVLQKFVQAG